MQISVKDLKEKKEKKKAYDYKAYYDKLKIDPKHNKRYSFLEFIQEGSLIVDIEDGFVGIVEEIEDEHTVFVSLSNSKKIIGSAIYCGKIDCMEFRKVAVVKPILVGDPKDPKFKRSFFPDLKELQEEIVKKYKNKFKLTDFLTEKGFEIVNKI